MEFDSAGTALRYVIYHPPHIMLGLITPALTAHVNSKSKADMISSISPIHLSSDIQPCRRQHFLIIHSHGIVWSYVRCYTGEETCVFQNQGNQSIDCEKQLDMVYTSHWGDPDLSPSTPPTKPLLVTIFYDYTLSLAL